MKKLLILSLIFSSLLFSCSKKKEVVELKYSGEEFEQLAHETTPSHEKGADGLKLSDYGAGVDQHLSRALVYKRLAFFAVAFETGEQARAEALRLNQYYARNWLFDRVEGEPVLEDYVITTFKAINPKRVIQRVPKTQGSEHSTEHSSEHSAAPAHH